MKRIALFYGSTGGTTQAVAKKIAAKIDTEVQLFDVASANASEAESFDCIILGTSTWGIGDLQDDWESFLPTLTAINLKGKTIALFGLGDAQSYSDSFVDGMGTIYEAIKDKDCQIVGKVNIDGYDFDESAAVIDDQFVGLALDEDNDGDLTDSRIDNWLKDLMPSFE